MSYVTLSIMFFRIGLFGFGGGLAMLPLIFQSVQEFGVMTAEEFSNLVALSQVTPGPITINAATYVGFNYGGVLGSALATFAVCLPSLVLILLVMKFMTRFKESNILDGVLTGIRPVTVGLVAAAVIFMAETALIDRDLFSLEFIKNISNNVNLIPIGIFITTIVLAGKFKMNPIIITVVMAVLGVFLCG